MKACLSRLSIKQRAYVLELRAKGELVQPRNLTLNTLERRQVVRAEPVPGVNAVSFTLAPGWRS